MKLEDYIKRSISEYPSLYAGVDYESSRLKVLEQIFLVNGNGIEWANTGNPKTGGYAVDPQYVRRKGEWHRLKDKPYGKEVYDGPDIDRFFNEDWVEAVELNPPKDEPFGKMLLFRNSISRNPTYKGFVNEIPEDILTQSISLAYEWSEEKGEYAREDSSQKINHRRSENLNFHDKFDTKNPKYLLQIQSHRNWMKSLGRDDVFKPYPFWEVSWLYAHIDHSLIKNDWREGMIEVKEAALQYYKNTPYGHKDMCSTWVRADFDKVILKYATQGHTTEYMLSEYGMTFDDIPEFKGLKLSVDMPNVEQLGEIFASRRYTRESNRRIKLLEEAIQTLKKYRCCL